MKTTISRPLLLSLLLFSGQVFAQSQPAATLPEWDKLTPQQREEARALFDRMRQMPPEDRKKLREDWSQMTPEQRRVWVQKNPPKAMPEPPTR